MHTSIGLRLVFGCLLALTACSGDDDEPAPSDAGANEPNDRRDASAAGSGGEGTGSGKEGSECESNADCESALTCLAADRQLASLKVCARHCAEDNECEDGELCHTDTGKPADAFCMNRETEAFRPCGPAATADCDIDENLGCLRIAEQGSTAGGVCLHPCTLNEDDACPDGSTCLAILDQEDQGLCVRTVERDGACNEVKGEFCEPGNLCLTDSDSWRCYQDCTESKQCDDEKECRALSGSSEGGSYCE